jgi:hypothetical protein
MPRLIEIVMFLTPIAAFVAWRLTANRIPGWFLGALASVIVLLLGGLLWTHQQSARDSAMQYQPAQLQDGRIIPGRAVSQ